jgi:aspartate-semialdehyde dehydrogenase
MTPRDKVPVAVLGATGSVGQRFLTLLADHPWFDVQALTASDRSAGKAYGDAANWLQSTPLPERFARMEVLKSTPPIPCQLVFSALDASVAGEVETAFASLGHVVVSNAKSHRMDPSVPLVVPEVNPEHLQLARTSSNGGGAILTNPNCSTIGLVLALKPLWDAFGLKRVSVVTMQAISGAGFPGVPSYQILDNVVPYIPGEEEKIESETRKILGTFDSGAVRDAEIRLSAQCHRVPVLDGHLLAVSVELGRKAEASELRDAWERFSGEPQAKALPTAPRHPVHFLEEDDAPQPRLHRDLDGGMAASVGRLRPCSILDFKFDTLSHNTIRGAAGGALLLAELAVAKGLLERQGARTVGAET